MAKKIKLTREEISGIEKHWKGRSNNTDILAVIFTLNSIQSEFAENEKKKNQLLKSAQRELERYLLLTGPELVCQGCEAEIERTKTTTFEDIPHHDWCILKRISVELEGV